MCESYRKDVSSYEHGLDDNWKPAGSQEILLPQLQTILFSTLAHSWEGYFHLTVKILLTSLSAWQGLSDPKRGHFW